MDDFQLRLFALHDQVITQNLGLTEKEMKEQEYGQITTQEATTQEVKQKPEPTTPQHTPKPKWR